MSGIAGGGVEELEQIIENTNDLDGNTDEIEEKLDTIADKLDTIDTSIEEGTVIIEDSQAKEVKQPDVLGDGSAIDRQEDGTVGTTKGTMILGVDNQNKARPINIVGTDSPSLRVTNLTDREIQQQLLVEAKIRNLHLSKISGEKFTEKDVK